MNKRWIKIFTLLLILQMFIYVFVGCSKKPVDNVEDKDTEEAVDVNQSDEGEEVDVDVSEILYSFKDIEDSSGLPDWEGEKRKLKVWYGHGTGSSYSREYPERNLVNEEIERVTGISIDVENSFDNDGQDFNTKLGMIAASGDWPDLIVEGKIVNQEDDLIVGDKIWELSSYIDKYLPDLYDIYPKDKVTWWDKESSLNSNGKIYTVSTALNINYLSDVRSNVDQEKLFRILPPSDTNGGFGYLLVRDDILKQIYPNAKTVKEIEEAYMANNGTFTRDDLYDVTISSYEDLENLLKAAKDLNIEENGRALEPFFCLSGEDNWPLLAFLDGYMKGHGDVNSYFTYWDNADKKVKYMYEQEWFKENLKFYNKLQREGLASKEALVDNKSIFDTKLNNGAYITSYAWLTPDEAALNAAGKDFAYRKVFITVPWDSERFVMFKGVPSAHYNISIVKDAVKEEELPQILRWIGFNISDAGSKLQQWGPKSANLWEEKDGKRVFTDKDLEDEIVYKVANGRSKELGIGNQLFPGLPSYVNGADVNSPLYMYEEVELKASMANTYFRSGVVDPPKYTLGIAAEIYNLFQYVPETERFWAARPGFESLLTKCIAAESDKQFEKLYEDLLDYAATNGLTEETLEQLNAAYAEHVNKDYMDLIK